ncbi:MAG TPA: hypothetical protein VJT08_20375, partial [Terriglobales bacterium]|nr:hypothetical protein [Terriglobales bacterium]
GQTPPAFSFKWPPEIVIDRTAIYEVLEECKFLAEGVSETKFSRKRFSSADPHKLRSVPL